MDKRNREQKIDDILDQIIKSGEGSLSRSQRVFLDNVSSGRFDKFEYPDKGQVYTSDDGRFEFRFDEYEHKDTFIVFNGELEINNNLYYGSIIFNSEDGSFFSCDFSDEDNNMLEDNFYTDEIEEICEFLSTIL